MKIKEVRIDKKLTQDQCANILGVSRRTYQNIEKNDDGSAKYIKYLNALENYQIKPFKTDVVLGDDLIKITKLVSSYKKRFCYKSLKDYMTNQYLGKVAILYGLRRTGKTTLLFQLLGELNKNESAYIKVKPSNNMGDLISDINSLKSYGYKNILIDEVTLLDDFISASASLSDIYSMMGMKIVLSGTDSLGFALADRDELYDRNIMIHTSYISFKEFSYLLGIDDVDQYIEYGGTLRAENMSFDDDYKNESLSFASDESTRKYIDTAISKNIQHSLRNKDSGINFGKLRELYENNELTNVINRVVQDVNHNFVKRVIDSSFKSTDLGSARELLLNNESPIIQTALYDINIEDVLKRMKDIIDVKEKEERKVEIDEASFKQIESYLFTLDLLTKIKIRHENGYVEERIVFTQPGMRYSITKALIYSLINDNYFASLGTYEKKFIVDKILQDVKGKMLEDIVILETTMSKNEEDAFKFVFTLSGEYDLVTLDRNAYTFDLFEVKHSKKVSFENQAKFLVDEDMLNVMKSKFGTLNNRYVLYKGNNTTVNGIIYQNVEDYLINLK